VPPRHRGTDIALFVAAHAGTAGRQGNTVGTYICADLACSLYIRGIKDLELPQGETAGPRNGPAACGIGWTASSTGAWPRPERPGQLGYRVRADPRAAPRGRGPLPAVYRPQDVVRAAHAPA